jgi:hypothetical protein
VLTLNCGNNYRSLPQLCGHIGRLNTTEHTQAAALVDYGEPNENLPGLSDPTVCKEDAYPRQLPTYVITKKKLS